jgi:serine O-acetyltransferase
MSVQAMPIWRILGTDLRLKARWCYEDESWRAVVKTLLSDGTMAMVFYRLMQYCGNHRLAPLEMLFNKLNSMFCNCIIGRGAEFGPGFVLIHATGVVINGGVRGGSRVVLEHQVTIGAERRKTPVLGDDVFVGAGAKVIGQVTIGSHARIGANAVVVKDVPAYATAVGVPAKVVRVRRPASAEHGLSVVSSGR